MKISHIVALAKDYDILLTRYARLIIKEKDAAERLVLRVFEQYYDRQIILTGIALRKYLQSRVARNCREWMRNQSAGVHGFHNNSLN